MSPLEDLVGTGRPIELVTGVQQTGEFSRFLPGRYLGEVLDCVFLTLLERLHSQQYINSQRTKSGFGSPEYKL